MGYTTAMNVSQILGLEEGLKAHFRGNCYPPIPLAMVPVAKEVIENVVQGECEQDSSYLDIMIQLPKMEDGFQITHKGSDKVRTEDALYGLHLAAFVDSILMEEE